MQDKLEQLKNKLPDGNIKDAVQEKMRYVNKPIRK